MGRDLVYFDDGVPKPVVATDYPICGMECHGCGDTIIDHYGVVVRYSGSEPWPLCRDECLPELLVHALFSN